MSLTVRWLAIILLIPVLILLGLTTGELTISVSDVWNYIFSINNNEQSFLILSQFRIPRVFVALFSGVAISLSGLILQSIFRNPLAGPHVLGITSGAMLGAALFILGFSWLFVDMVNGYQYGLLFSSFIGAFAMLMVILFISSRIQQQVTVLVAGLLAGTGISAIIDLLQYSAENQSLKSFVTWSMGSFTRVQPNFIAPFAFIVIILSLVSWLLSKPLNALMLGEENALIIGIKAKKVQTLAFIITGLLVAITTALCGPLAFVGIIVPHLARLYFNTANHRILIPASAVIGANVLLLADALATGTIFGMSVPVNTVSSLMAIPVIFYLLFSRRYIVV